MKVTRILASTLAATLFAASSLVAQHAAKAQTPTTRPMTHRTAPTGQTAKPAATPRPMSFKGIANKLGTTPDALESAYQAALAANPKLTRGQFVAANVLAKNLGDKNPAITTQAILDGLKSGKSIGQTLKSLGVKDDQARDAQRAANREIQQAQKDTTD
jgi:hypothetical protein